MAKTTCTEFELTDDEGNVRAHLFLGGNGAPKLRLMDAAGVVRVHAGIEVDNTPFVDLNADNGIPILSLSLSPGARGIAIPGITIKAPEGQYELLARVKSGG